MLYAALNLILTVVSTVHFHAMKIRSLIKALYFPFPSSSEILLML